MNPVFPLSHLRRAVNGAAAALIALAAFALGAVSRAEQTGPVQPPTDTFGGPGPYGVTVQTFPSPDWAGQVVTVYLPEGALGRRPAWFFAHGFGGTDPAYYGELLHHLASHGEVVVFSPYPANLLNVADNYATLYDGFTAAARRFADRIDTSRVGFAGHSYGGGAVPALALRAVRELGWGANGLAVLLLAPWYSYSVSDADLASFPATTQAVVQIYEDDVMNDHRMAIDLFTHLNLPPADKDFLMVHSDRVAGYNYDASHRTPTGASTPREGAEFNALDSWGVLRIAQALAASTFDHDPAARALALGNGSAAQTQMGTTASGRALRAMTETDSPVPLFPSSRYIQSWDSVLNPRFGVTLPPVAHRPRLLNLSVRANSGTGEDLLIAGAAVAGNRPKSLLVRAVGPGLTAQQVPNAAPNPRLIVFRGPASDVDVDDWEDSPDQDAITAATEETGAFPLADRSRDAALLMSFSPGILTVQAPPSDGRVGNTLVEVYDGEDDGAAELVNLSARASVGTGHDVLIAGFVTGPGENLHLLLRGVGPGLAALGISHPLANPVLELYRGSERIAANDDWSADAAQAAESAAAATQAGAFPLPAGSTDAGMVVTLPPGAYTIHVRSADGSAGIALAEIYLLR